MSTLSILTDLTAALDEAEPGLATLDKYSDGTQPLAFLAPEAKVALGNRLQRVAVNVPRLVTGSLAERLHVQGFTVAGQADEQLTADWLRNGMDQGQGVAHREALTLGRGFVMVWSDAAGAPSVTVESAHNVAVQRDPMTGEVLAAVKRWKLPNGKGQRAVVLEADTITPYSTTSPDTATAGSWTLAGDVLDNPLGMPPVVPLVNAERLLDVDGRSEFADVMPLVDALNKLTADMLVTSESFARPRRWATGLEIPEDDAGNPINPFASEADRTWMSEDDGTRFGQFPATDLGAYANAVKIINQHISAVSGLPAHYLGINSDNPTSADAIRSAEASLVARVLARQAAFTPAWGRVGALIRAVRTGEDPRQLDVRPVWASAETRTPAQTADAVSKLVGAGILPVSEALRQLGYSPDEVDRIRSARRADTLDTAGLNLAVGAGNA